MSSYLIHYAAYDLDQTPVAACGSEQWDATTRDPAKVTCVECKR